MPTVRDVEALLEEEAKNVAIKKQQDDEADGRRDDRHDRRSDRHDRRDRSRDRYRHRESNGDRRRSRDRDHRARDGSRPRSSKGADTDEDDRHRRSSSRDRYRGSRRDRGGDYYSGGGRPRSRSPRRDRDRDSRYRERRERSNHRGREDRRDGRGSGAPKTPTPDVDEDDRDSRTVFVQQISQRAETADLRKFFKKAGDVVEAQIVKDRVTHRSKGVGYVEFLHVDSVAKALEMTGQKLKGVPIICQLAEAEKNRAPRPSEGGPAPGANGAPFHRLYVGNIHFSVAEDDLKEIFTPYGELEQVILQRDETNPSRSKGYGFVQFVEPNDAKAALAEMNGFELAGRQIRVGLGNDKFTPESTANLLRSFSQHTQTYQGSGVFGAGGRGAHAGGSGGTFDRANGKDDRAAGGASALDDSDVGGVNYKSFDRSKLMNNLARGEIAQPSNPTATSVVNQRRVPVEQPAASRCIKIENAFNSDEEQKAYGDVWITELQQEVKIECDKKYGKVVHIAVDPNSDGEIFVKFEDVAGGQRAMQGLNGRRFNHRIIRASYVVDAIYNTQWPAAVGKV